MQQLIEKGQNRRNKLIIIYEAFIVVLAIISIVLLIYSFTTQVSPKTDATFALIDDIILIIFSIDYFTRLALSKNKWTFVKSNIFDLISIIPFSQAFRAFRIARFARIFKIIRVVRIVALFGKIESRSKEFFKTNHFNYVVFISIFVVLLGAIGIYFAEGKTFGDALWWSFVTTTTVGYGDISPKTGTGRLIATALMLVGIGFIGMLTSTLATFFIKPNKPIHKNFDQDILDVIKNKIDDFDDLSDEEVKDICNVLTGLKNK